MISPPIPQDTPITRASIAEMPDEDLQELVASLQERRLRLHKIYLAGVEAKKRAASEKAALDLDKRLKQFAAKEVTVIKALDTLAKYADDIMAWRVLAGDMENLDGSKS